MKTYLVLDAFNIIHRSAAQKNIAGFRNSIGIPTGHFFGLFRMVLSLKQKCQATDLIVAWDSNPQWKRDLFPGYKASRNHSIVPGQVDIRTEGRHFLESLNATHLWCEGEECDDVMATFVKQLPPFGVNCFISTTDRDLWQLIPKATIIGKDVVTSEMVREEFKVEPRCIPLYKSLYGDASDELPKVPRLKWDDVQDAVKLSGGDIAKFWDLTITCCKPEIISKLQEYKTQIDINYKLAKLKTDLPLKITKTTPNKDQMLQWINFYECNSLLPKVDELLN